MVHQSTILTIYRCLLRDTTRLLQQPHFRLRNELVLEHWGIGQFLRQEINDDCNNQITIESLKHYKQLKHDGFQWNCGNGNILNTVKKEFRKYRHLKDPKEISDKIDDAIAAMREVSQQLILAKCSSTTITNGVCVDATSQYIPQHSEPANNMYRFTYRLTITNTNKQGSIQITGRQYTFESSKNQRFSLPRHSKGVVGQTPILSPGQTFQYASGIDLDASSGSVVGCLHAIERGHNITQVETSEDQDEDNKNQHKDGIEFDICVSKFRLEVNT